MLKYRYTYFYFVCFYISCDISVICLCLGYKCTCVWMCVLVRLPCPRAQPWIPFLPHLHSLWDLHLLLGFQCRLYTDDSQRCICSPERSLLDISGTLTVNMAFSLAFHSWGGVFRNQPIHIESEEPTTCASEQTLLHSALSAVGRRWLQTPRRKSTL